ncbi:MAG TPA: sigma-54 dependent transcriptional regulator [Pyrinomonadaceae bacterium]|nr:sigma-54 dependent transcriptional regulator [Pyrinomonadaceae bacterium]
MSRILLIESDRSDAENFKSLLGGKDYDIVWCDSTMEAEKVIAAAQPGDFAAAVICWEISEPRIGFRLLQLCRSVLPEVPVMVISTTLDAAMATRAHALGARDFLEKPLYPEELNTRISSLLADETSRSPLLDEMRETIKGNSPSLLAAFRQLAKVITRDDLSVLFIGEPGTGKELFAQAIHQLGPRKAKPWVAINIAAVPDTLIESQLFGFEKGAFTGATEPRPGVFELSSEGTLFLDEIGDLDLSLQVKLLRVLQEKTFSRLGSSSPRSFKARVVFATNRDLTQSVNNGTFRRDLFDRITEVQVHVPSLRERHDDVILLFEHFLKIYGQGRNLGYARETISILKSYPFPGNVRELQNLVKGAVIECDNDIILPNHLPLERMGAFLDNGQPEEDAGEEILPCELLAELRRLLPADWLEREYREAIQPYERAFDRIYLSHLLKRHRHNVTRAAAAAGLDGKTFRKRWKDCGLPSLTASEESPDG